VRRNMYVDENKERGYLIMGAVIDSAHVPHVRRTLRSLLLPGQERLHMTAERDSRRAANQRCGQRMRWSGRTPAAGSGARSSPALWLLKWSMSDLGQGMRLSITCRLQRTPPSSRRCYSSMGLPFDSWSRLRRNCSSFALERSHSPKI